VTPITLRSSLPSPSAAGHGLSELDPSFADWNAQVEKDGRIVPNIARL
jgi:hypothetical protein